MAALHHIYIYIERERERERESLLTLDAADFCVWRLLDLHDCSHHSKRLVT